LKLTVKFYTNAVLANLTIRSGRTNIYEQAQAGYANIQLIDLDQLAIPFHFNNSSISIEVQDSSGHLSQSSAARR
jgi:hypothetical protein